MTDCSTHEIAIERRAAGVLTSGEASRLEAHLATCASCRHHATSVDRLKTMIDTSNASAALDPALTWRRVHTYVARSEERFRRKLTRTLPIGLTAAAAVAILALAAGSTWLTLFSLGFLLAGFANLWAIFAAQRRLKLLAASPGDLVAFVRREHTRARVLAATGAVFAAVLGVLWLGTGLDAPPAWLPTFGHDGSAPLAFALAALFFAYAAYLVIVVGPRLAREARELAE